VLVVGCGSGREAAVLAHELDAEVIGIDLSDAFDPVAARIADLRQGDATRMEFADASFDCVYSYHALEHIPDYRAALAEMQRVLEDGGTYCIGTPNRHRLFAYFGSSQTSWRLKVAWNLADWKARILGRFRNEFGAHAGYSAAELRHLLAAAFGDAEEISVTYYRQLYRRQATLVTLLAATGLGRFSFPAVYFLGQAGQRHG
jgi:ubiquinone/menaquinone biosynthesis C-methylase UbiE